VAPIRTVSIAPLIEILAVPVAASVRDGCFLSLPEEDPLLLPLDPPDEDGVLVEAVLPAVEEALICWANGSLPLKWLKE
jgi:hypothetical protein